MAGQRARAAESDREHGRALARPRDPARMICRGRSGRADRAVPARARRSDRARAGRRGAVASSSSSFGACSSSSCRSRSCGGGSTTTVAAIARRVDRRVQPSRLGDVGDARRVGHRRPVAGDRAARSAAAAERRDHRARDEDGGDRAGGDRGGAQGDARQSTSRGGDAGHRRADALPKDQGIRMPEHIYAQDMKPCIRVGREFGHIVRSYLLGPVGL